MNGYNTITHLKRRLGEPASTPSFKNIAHGINLDMMYSEVPLQMGSDWGGGRPRHSQTQYLPPNSRRAIHTESTACDKRGRI